MPAARAATASDIITATTSSSPSIGVIKTSVSQSVTITLKANVAATAVTLSLAQPGTATAYTGGGFAVSTNGCINKSLAAAATCTATVRFLSSTKGTFIADAFYSFTSGTVGYTGAIRFSATAGTVPASPTALTTTVASRTAMDLTWAPPADTGGIPITGYRITVTDAGTGSLIERTTQTPALTIDGLTVGITYSLRVYASNQLGESLAYASKSMVFVLPAPSAPQELAGVPRSTSIALSWRAATGFVDGYRIQIFNRADPASGTNEKASVTAQEFAYTITDLDPATPYTVKVVAFNASAATTASIDVTTERDLPEAPSDLSAIARKANMVSLSWTAPVQDVDGYVIEWSHDGEAWEDLPDAPEDPSATAFDIIDLEPDTHYLFRIRAYNGFGDGDVSEPVEIDTPSGLTNPVRNLTAVGVDETSVLLSWQAPEPSYADTVSYRIETRTIDVDALDTGDGEWQYVDEVDPDSTEYSVEGLQPCIVPANAIGIWSCPTTEYRVISVSDWGDSEEGDIVSAEPVFEWPAAPQITDAQAVSPGELLVTWSGVAGGSLDVAGYTILFSTDWASLACESFDDATPGECDFYADTADADAALREATISSLDAGHYYVRVIARMLSQTLGEITGPASEIAEVDVLGDVPPVEWVDVISVSEHTASFCWPTVDAPWGAATYRLELSDDGGDTWVQSGETSSESTSVDGLVSGRTYLARVTVEDRFSTAAPSEPVEFTTTLVGATDVTATSDDDWSVRLAWSADDDLIVITGWRIEQQLTAAGEDPGDDDWSEVAVVDADTTEYVMTEVQPCDATSASAECPDLHVRVTAVNDVTESAPSPPLKIQRNFLLPEPPTEVEATPINTTAFAVSWQPSTPGTARLIGYRVYYSTDEDVLIDCTATEFGGCGIDTDSYIDVGPDQTSATITGVDPATLWFVVVAPIAGSDHWGKILGQPSSPVAIQVPALLDPPANLNSSEVSFTSADISWDQVFNDDDSVVYTVELSTDGGSSWTVVTTTSDTWVTLPQLKPGTGYVVRVSASNRFTTSDGTETSFHTKSFAKPAQPRVEDFSIDGGGWLTIDPGGDTGATSVVFTARISAKQPGGRQIGIECASESLQCFAPDARPGTAYRMQVTAVADGGIRRSAWFTFTPPDVQLTITSEPVTMQDAVIDIDAWNLAPGTAFLVYGRQRMKISVDDDGYAAASVAIIGTGRKVITVMQGSRRATGEVWVTSVKAPYRAQPSSTAFIKVIGLSPGATLIVHTSTSLPLTLVSDGSLLAIPVSIPARGNVDWTVTVGNVVIAEGTVFARER